MNTKLTRAEVEALTNEAHSIHMATLEKYGNKPQDQQRTTLRALVRMFAEMFAGTVRGRYPWPLPTGAGKTTALVSVIVALENLKISGPSLAVGSNTVEALCRIKRDLEAAGVPSQKIGLYHAKKFDAKGPDLWLENDDYASLPATSGNDRRPYMLVTQQKIKSDERDVSDYFVFNGKLRDLCCWDESLFDTEYWHIPANSFKGATATLQGLKEREPGAGCENWKDFLL